MTQNFTVVETQTEKKGVYVSIKDTVSDVKSILDGKMDGLKPEDFLFIGTLKDLDDKIEALRRIKQAPSSQTNLPQQSTAAVATLSTTPPGTPTSSIETPAK